MDPNIEQAEYKPNVAAFEPASSGIENNNYMPPVPFDYTWCNGTATATADHSASFQHPLFSSNDYSYAPNMYPSCEPFVYPSCSQAFPPYSFFPNAYQMPTPPMRYDYGMEQERVILPSILQDNAPQFTQKSGRQRSRKSSVDGNGAPGRNSFSSKQLCILNRIYSEMPYLRLPVRKVLADRIGLTDHQVKIWFQNQRYKMKKQRSFAEKKAFSEEEAVLVIDRVFAEQERNRQLANTMCEIVDKAPPAFPFQSQQ